MADSSPKLQREVELPRPRSSGAAVVLVATMAMFTAVGASAFVVRARCHRHRASCPTKRPMASNPVRVDSQYATVIEQFRAARERGDLEEALRVYNRVDRSGRVAMELASEREDVAQQYLDSEYNRLAEDLERQDCAAADERLKHLKMLLWDKDIPVAMDRCR